MLVLILGLVIFLGVHSFTTFQGSRAALIDRVGAGAYKGLYSVASLAGFLLIIWGFSLYRAGGLVPLWSPPMWARHLTLTLMWLAFVALAANSPAPGKIKGWLRHPMLAGVTIWALAHLLANGDLGGAVLFGSFLAWAIYDRVAVSVRGNNGAMRMKTFTRADAIALGAGTIAYVAMIFLHPILIGVSVLGM